MSAVTNEGWSGESSAHPVALDGGPYGWINADGGPRVGMRRRDSTHDHAETVHPLRIDIDPLEHVLRKTKDVALGHYRCSAGDPRFAMQAGPFGCAYVVFHRNSMRLKTVAGRNTVVTPNHVSFFHVGDTYQRESIGGADDECDRIAIAPEALKQLFAHQVARRGFAASQLVPRSSAPIMPARFFSQRRLFAAVRSPATMLSSQQIDEMVMELMANIIGDALDFWIAQRQTRRLPRPTCQRRRLQIIQEAEALLAREYRTDLSLADMARQLHCSPAHLSRMFPAATGFKLNDYRQELRLRRGVFLLEESELDIGDIALQLGFASHSHFTSAFHRHFGVSPSEYLKLKFAGSRSRSLKPAKAREAVSEISTPEIARATG